MDIVTTLIWFIVIVAIGLGAAWFLRGYLSSGTQTPGLFGGGRDKRLGVLETTSVDGRRRLVLIQRDGVEHLIMTGGPVDVVIETGIQGATRRPPAGTQNAAPRAGSYEQFGSAHGGVDGNNTGYGRPRAAPGARPLEP